MSVDPEQKFNPEQHPQLPDDDAFMDESETLHMQDDDESHDSVFGGDEVPETAPNLSDGSTKVMSNEALIDMGLKVPDWRTTEFAAESFSSELQQETFIDPEREVAHQDEQTDEAAIDESEAYATDSSNDESNSGAVNAEYVDTPGADAGWPPLESATEIVPPNPFTLSPTAKSNSSSIPNVSVSDATGWLAPPRQPDHLDFSNLNVGQQAPRPEQLPLPAFEPLQATDLTVPRQPLTTASPATSVDVPASASAPGGQPVASPLVMPVAPALAVPAPRAARTPSPAIVESPSASVGKNTAIASQSPTAKSHSAATSHSQTTPEGDDPPKSNLLFTLLISYASALTLALLYLLMSGRASTMHHLESLPDVAPEGPKELSYVPNSMDLAPGHTLKLGEARRFGNILVEPIKVTREPIVFQHYTGDTGKTRPATPPVLKLWLRMTNVSSDQTIAPLDAPLLLKWVGKQGEDLEYTNQYLFPSDQREQRDSIVSIYRMPVAFDWDLAGQHLGQKLAPGESVEMYIPSTEDGTAEINAPVTWRVQLRKGFSPQGNGVTTIIEVKFDWSSVENAA